MKPKYYINEHMLYAVYPHACFYAGARGEWVESLIGKSDDYFERSEYMSPCNLKDVSQHFNNISAHKLTTPSVIAKEQQLPQICGIESAT